MLQDKLKAEVDLLSEEPPTLSPHVDEINNVLKREYSPTLTTSVGLEPG